VGPEALVDAGPPQADEALAVQPRLQQMTQLPAMALPMTQPQQPRLPLPDGAPVAAAVGAAAMRRPRRLKLRRAH
jgi:hypothetical protein